MRYFSRTGFSPSIPAHIALDEAEALEALEEIGGAKPGERLGDIFARKNALAEKALAHRRARIEEMKSRGEDVRQVEQKYREIREKYKELKVPKEMKDFELTKDHIEMAKKMSTAAKEKALEGELEAVLARISSRKLDRYSSTMIILQEMESILSDFMRSLGAGKDTPARNMLKQKANELGNLMTELGAGKLTPAEVSWLEANIAKGKGKTTIDIGGLREILKTEGAPEGIVRKINRLSQVLDGAYHRIRLLQDGGKILEGIKGRLGNEAELKKFLLLHNLNENVVKRLLGKEEKEAKLSEIKESDIKNFEGKEGEFSEIERVADAMELMLAPSIIEAVEGMTAEQIRSEIMKGKEASFLPEEFVSRLRKEAEDQFEKRVNEAEEGEKAELRERKEEIIDEMIEEGVMRENRKLLRLFDEQILREISQLEGKGFTLQSHQRTMVRLFSESADGIFLSAAAGGGEIFCIYHYIRA